MKDFLILISPLQFPICLDTVKGDFYWIESFQKKSLICLLISKIIITFATEN